MNQKPSQKLSFCPFTVIGFPTMEKSLRIVRDFVEGKGPSRVFGKANFLELGIPFSDPTADGPVIQRASQTAIRHGFHLSKLFPFLKAVRKFTNIPIGLLTYANPVYQYGIRKFYSDAKTAGASNILVADLSFEEAEHFLRASRATGLSQVFMVSEKTPRDRKRLEKILDSSKPYVYVMSRNDVTGAKKNIPKNLGAFIKTLKSCTKIPLMVGFGISKKSHVKKLQLFGANGFIIGSNLVKAYATNSR